MSSKVAESLQQIIMSEDEGTELRSFLLENGARLSTNSEENPRPQGLRELTIYTFMPVVCDISFQSYCIPTFKRTCGYRFKKNAIRVYHGNLPYSRYELECLPATMSTSLNSLFCLLLCHAGLDA